MQNNKFEKTGWLHKETITYKHSRRDKYIRTQ